MKQIRNSEAGFFLQEAILLGILLVFMAGALLAYERAARMEVQEACHMQAIFMAKEQLANMEARADAGTLTAGDCGWLGDPGRLVTDQGQFSVRATASPMEFADAYHVVVYATWQSCGDTGEISMERGMYRHAR